MHSVRRQQQDYRRFWAMLSVMKGEAMPQKHGRTDENGTRIWFTERLWELARELPVHSVPIDSIREFDQNCWFHDEAPPTCRNVARHAQRIQQADLSYPVILSADGGLMDGGHRLCKAWLLGHTEIRAVRFVTDPEPDEVRAVAPPSEVI